MELLSSEAVVQRLTENERWKAIGRLQNGSTQLHSWSDSSTRRSLSSADYGTSISTLEM